MSQNYGFRDHEAGRASVTVHEAGRASVTAFTIYLQRRQQK